MRTATTLTIAALIVALCSCTRDAGPPDDATDGATADTPTNRIDIPAIVRNNLGITFAEVERREVGSTIRAPGAFELEPLARREYRIPLSGRVELLVDQYDEVSPGDVLYRFRSPQWPELQHEIIAGEQAVASAGAEVDVAQAKIDEAQAHLIQLRERLGALAAADFKQADLEVEVAKLEASVPRLEAELRLAETKRANAERTREHALHRAAAALGIDEASLSEVVEVDGTPVAAYRTIDWIEVRAAQPGVIEALHVTDGSYLETPSLVVTTVDPSRIRFRAMGLQADLPRLSTGSPARIVPPRSPGLEINDSVDAALAIGLEAHPDQRTITLLATPAELRRWTRPGVSAFLEVVVESTGGPALAIPLSAVVQDGVTHVFFRRDPDDPNKVIRVEADLGVSDGRWVAVKSGLRLGDQVVLDGAYELKLASEQGGRTQRGGHFHADGTFHESH